MDQNNSGFIGGDNSNSGNQSQNQDQNAGQPTAEQLMEENKRLQAEFETKNQELKQSQEKAQQLEQQFQQNQQIKPQVDPEVSTIVQNLRQGGVATIEDLDKINSNNQNLVGAMMLQIKAESFANNINSNARIPELKVNPNDLAAFAVQHNYVGKDGTPDFQSAYDAMTWKVQLERKDDIEKGFSGSGGNTVQSNYTPNQADNISVSDDDSFEEGINKILDSAGWRR